MMKGWRAAVLIDLRLLTITVSGKGGPKKVHLFIFHFYNGILNVKNFGYTGKTVLAVILID